MGLAWVMAAYYNEHDPKAAAWLRELIRRDLIADGEVDERSIVDVRPGDLAGFRQCHFFAGIGVWSHALRRAGWSDDREVWTGSCPCQPFSAAGKGEAYADERHLWPHWHRLIRECRPSAVFGEQVSAAIRTGWLDDVCLSLEELGYAIGAVDFPACSVGAPHIRQRLYFVAHTQCGTAERHGHGVAEAARGAQSEAHERQRFRPDSCNGGESCAMADSNGGRLIQRDEGERAVSIADEDGNVGNPPSGGRRERTPWQGSSGHADSAEQSGGLADAERERGRCGTTWSQDAGDAREPSEASFWSDAIWINCTDGKARPTKPGIFPLAYGYPQRVGLLRGAGNAIVGPQAEEFIRAYLEAERMK